MPGQCSCKLRFSAGELLRIPEHSSRLCARPDSELDLNWDGARSIATGCCSEREGLWRYLHNHCRRLLRARCYELVGPAGILPDGTARRAPWDRGHDLPSRRVEGCTQTPRSHSTEELVLLRRTGEGLRLLLNYTESELGATKHHSSVLSTSLYSGLRRTPSTKSYSADLDKSGFAASG